MDDVKIPLSIKILYWLTNIVLGLMVLILAVVVVFNVLLYTDFFGDNVQMHAQLPVQVDFLETGNLYLNKQNVRVELVDANTKIHFFNTPDFISRRVGIFVIVVTIIGIALVRIFQLFMKNVRNGDVFSNRNILLLKNMAYGLLGLWLLVLIYMRLAYHLIAKNLFFENVRIGEDLPNYIGILAASLFIWILAHIFGVGLQLQQEKNLTI